MESVRQDLRHAVRALLKAPGFALVAIATLALAIGANTAMFSALYAVLLRPLPYAEPDRLFLVWEDASYYGNPKDTPAVANYVDWREQSRSFSDMAAVSTDNFNLTGTSEPEQIGGASVTANLVSLLGAKPELGREFAKGEDEAGAARVVLLSHRLWQRRFGADPGVIGRSITLSGVPSTIVGVMPASFQFPSAETELWTPFAWNAEVRADRGNHYLLVVGRLSPGVARSAAQAEMTGIAARLARQYPETNTSLGSNIEPLRDFYSGDVRPALLALMGAVGFVLLVACTNVASLLLARSARRASELCVRAALGAEPRRLMRLVFTESLVLATLGTLVAIALAAALVRALSALMPSGLQGQIRLELPVLAFATALALLTSLLFGTVPAWQAARVDLVPGLRETGRGLAGGHRRLRGALVIGELALSLCLLIGAGLMLRTLVALVATPVGFQGTQALIVRTPLAGERYRPHEARLRFFREVLDKVAALPGVEAAGYTSHVPLTWGGDQNSVIFEGRPVPPPGQQQILPVRVVTPDYFRAAGTAVVSGRAFDDHDAPSGEKVALVNQAFARRYFAGADPLGSRVQRGDQIVEGNWLKIVGVVQDTPQFAVEQGAKPELYLPHTQFRGNYFVPKDLVVRTQGAPLALAAAVRDAVHQVDKEQPVSAARTLDSVVKGALAQRRFQSLLFAAFAGVALLLAAVGVFGVLSQLVAQRQREFGVRMALGAQARDVLRLVVGHAFTLVLAGSALGVLGYLALRRFLASLLYQVAATDPWTIGGVTLLLCAAALLAAAVPAWRAARLDPAEVLRAE